MNTPQHDQLTRALAREAEQFHGRGGTELEIGQVLARAGEIRRGRRMRASLLMAACVLAIVAPVGIVALDHDTSRREPTPARQVQDRSPVRLAGLEHGDQPHTGYAEAGQFNLSSGSFGIARKGQTVAAVAQVGSSVLVATRDDQGELTAHVVDDQGGTDGTTWPMQGSFATSPDGQVAAFVQPDGTPILVRAHDRRTLSPVRGKGAFTAAAISGLDCTAPNPGGCTVWIDVDGQAPTVWRAYASGTTQQLDTDLRSVVDVADGGRAAGVVSVSDGGSCSKVGVLGDADLWQTCDRRLISFSPDGRHVLASAAYADGMGDTQLAVLDAATGKPTLDLQAADGDVITQMVWEDDSHVLAVVFEGGRWGVVRIGLDGRRELAVSPVRDSGDLASPFVLATR